MAPKYAKGWRGSRGEHPGMDILTTGEETVPSSHNPHPGFHNPHPVFGIVSSPVVSMFIPGVFPLVSPHPFAYFGTIFPTKILVPKLVNIAFSLRPEEALLVLTL